MKVCLERVLLLALPVLLAMGCEKPPPRALHTVNYYRTHEAERNARLEECRKDPAGMSQNADCLNATQAETSAN
jgi:hypothetical protein